MSDTFQLDDETRIVVEQDTDAESPRGACAETGAAGLEPSSSSFSFSSVTAPSTLLVLGTSSVGAARRFLVDSLERWGLPHLEWDAVQVLSELATNAVVHAGTPVRLTVSRLDDRVRVGVGDGGGSDHGDHA